MSLHFVPALSYIRYVLSDARPSYGTGMGRALIHPQGRTYIRAGFEPAHHERTRAVPL